MRVGIVAVGIGLVFELPILIFFLTLLRIVTPGFLIKQWRYSTLIIFVIAAITDVYDGHLARTQHNRQRLSHPQR